MIPYGSCMNNYNNQIQIKLTNDNKCIIQNLSESPIKFQNTNKKEDCSINDDMSLSKSNSMINAHSHNSSKKININSINEKNQIIDFNDLNNSNLLISFSNISEVGKNNDTSLFRINSFKNEPQAQNQEQNSKSIINLNNNDLSERMQITLGDKNLTINNIYNYNINSEANSILSNKNIFVSNEKDGKINISSNNDVNDGISAISMNLSSKTKEKNADFREKINKQLINLFNKNDVNNSRLNNDDKNESIDRVKIIESNKKRTKNIQVGDIKVFDLDKKEPIDMKLFKNCIVQKNEDINIIQKMKVSSKKEEKNNNLIIPNHCTNFYYNGLPQKTNNNNIKELNPINNQKNNLENETNDDYVSPTFNVDLNYNALNTLELGSEKMKQKENDNDNKKNEKNNYIKLNDNQYISLKNDKLNNNIGLKSSVLTLELSEKDKKNNLNINSIGKDNSCSIKEKTQPKIEDKNKNNSKVRDLLNNKNKIEKKNVDLSRKNSKEEKLDMNKINDLNNKDDKCRQLKVMKKNHNIRYIHQYSDLNNINFNLIKLLYSSMGDMSKKRKKNLSTSHNKTKSVSGSLIKMNMEDYNLFNIKSGNMARRKKKIKSISPGKKIVKIDDKKDKNQNKSRSLTKNKTKFDILDYQSFCKINNNNNNKQMTFKEKMDIFLTKNIIALAKKRRKSPSPRLRLSKNPIQRINVFTQQNNTLYNNKVSSSQSRGEKNLSPLPNQISKNNYYNLNNISNKVNNKNKIIFYKNNEDKSLQLMNIIEERAKDNSKNNNQNSLSLKKKLQIKTKPNQNVTYKHTENSPNKMNYNISVINTRKSNQNTLLNPGKNNKQVNSKFSKCKNKTRTNRCIQASKNNLMLDNMKQINKISKKQMTIIENFSMYKKKTDLMNVNNKILTLNNRIYGQNENKSNNTINENHMNHKNKVLNMNNFENHTLEVNKLKQEYYYITQPKSTENNNCIYYS